jgi:hypothetical protein
MAHNNADSSASVFNGFRPRWMATTSQVTNQIVTAVSLHFRLCRLVSMSVEFLMAFASTIILGFSLIEMQDE